MGSPAARPARLAAAVALVGALLTCLLPAVPPGQDTPPHLTTIAVQHDPEHFAQWYEVVGAPTAQAFETIAGPFVSSCGLFGAARIALAVLVLLLAFGTSAAARALGGSANAGLALGAAYGVGWMWAMGFYNFTASLAFGVWAIPLLFGRRPGARDRALAAGLLLAAAWAHIIAAGMLLVHLLACRLLEPAGTTNRPLPRVVAADALTALPATAYVAVLIARAFGTASHSGRVGSVGTHHGTIAEIASDVLQTSYGGFTNLGWLAGAGALAAVVFALFDRASRRAAWLPIGWIALMAIVPLHGLGWHFARPRCGYFALVLTVAALPLLRRRFAESLACALAAALVVAGLAGAMVEGQRAEAAVRALDVEDAGRTLEVVFHAEPIVRSAPYVRSAIGFPHYATLGGGAVPGSFAVNPIKHAIRFAAPMHELFPQTELFGIDVSAACMADLACYRGDAWRADQIARTGVHWDSVAVVDAPAAVRERLLARGFVAIDEMLFRPRPASIDVPLPRGLRGEIQWTLGYPETVGVLSRGAAVVSADGSAIRIDDLPAGPIRVELVLDGRLLYADSIDLPAATTHTIELGRPSRALGVDSDRDPGE